MKRVTNPAPTIDWFRGKLNWKHLVDLPVGEVGGTIDLLIGMDFAHLLMVQESRQGNPSPLGGPSRIL